MVRLLLLCAFLLSSLLLIQAQSYQSWITGDTADAQVAPTLPGLVLAGGAGDNDEAMQWMLSRAGGGDVVVLRASGSDGYNSYFYSELGMDIHSVETIRFNTAEAAADPYVINRIRNAECLFIAGGDQYDYYRFWKDTPVEDAINYLINEKRAPVGGTSAGMAILAQCYYTPSGGSLDTEEALANPFHPDYDILACNDFLRVPFTDYLLPDTHYEQRERPGRHVAMLARIAQEYGRRSFGIACNEYTAVAIDESGIAHAFGEYPEYEEDYVFFLQANCQEEILPEVMESGVPLTWDRSQSAVKVYAVPASPGGGHFLDLNDWKSGEGGQWQNWYIREGELFKSFDTGSDCAAVLSSASQVPAHDGLQLFPNPAADELFLVAPADLEVQQLVLYNAYGQTLRRWPGTERNLNIRELNTGLYYLQLIAEAGFITRRFVKE